MPKMMKKVQHMRTMFPIGFKDDSKVCTTSLRPGALLMTLKGLRALTRRKTRRISKILDVWPNITVHKVSNSDTITSVPSITFQPDLK